MALWCCWITADCYFWMHISVMLFKVAEMPDFRQSKEKMFVFQRYSCHFSQIGKWWLYTYQICCNKINAFEDRHRHWVAMLNCRHEKRVVLYQWIFASRFNAHKTDIQQTHSMKSSICHWDVFLAVEGQFLLPPLKMSPPERASASCPAKSQAAKPSRQG